MQNDNGYFTLFMIPILPFLMAFEKTHFSRNLSREIMNSVILNFNFWHAHSSAFRKINNVTNLNTICNANDCFILFIFLILT